MRKPRPAALSLAATAAVVTLIAGGTGAAIADGGERPGRPGEGSHTRPTPSGVPTAHPTSDDEHGEDHSDEIDDEIDDDASHAPEAEESEAPETHAPEVEDTEESEAEETHGPHAHGAGHAESHPTGRPTEVPSAPASDSATDAPSTLPTPAAAAAASKSDDAPGLAGQTPVTSAELADVKEAVAAEFPSLKVNRVRQDADGSYDVRASKKSGARVRLDVSEDLSTVTVVSTSAAGGAKAPKRG